MTPAQQDQGRYKMNKHIRINRLASVGLAAFLAFGLGLGLGAQTIRINVATVAPEKSPFGTTMLKVAAEWKKISNGRVELKTYFGDKLGDEEALVQKMRTNSIQGAVLTTVGISYIDKDLLTLSAPLLIQDDDQFKFVMDRLMPDFTGRLRKAGFEQVAFSRAGWLHFFSKTPFTKPDEIKKVKLGISSKSKELYETFKTLGYQVVNVDIAETLANLLTGRAEAIFTSPLVAGTYNWVGSTRYMLDLPISPFFGSFVINNKTWERIPADLRQPLLEATSKIASSELDGSLAKLTAEAITLMLNTEGGLIMQRASEADKALWRKEMETGLKLTLGNAFNQELYDRVKKILSDYKK
jgi:TRAP-type C4-dicarboxylate transport system substrate-binding protein